MNCDRARVLIGVYDELDEPTRRALHEHVTACAGCTDTWLGEDAFRALVVGLPSPPPATPGHLAALLAIPARVDLRWVRLRYLTSRIGSLTLAVALVTAGLWFAAHAPSSPFFPSPDGVSGRLAPGAIHAGAPAAPAGGSTVAGAPAEPTPVARIGTSDLHVAPPARPALAVVAPDVAGSTGGRVERVVFVVATPAPGPLSGPNAQDIALAVAAPTSAVSAQRPPDRHRPDRTDRPVANTPVPPAPTAAPATATSAPTWGLTVVVLPDPPAERPSGELLVTVDAVDESSTEWEPLAERYATFDAQGELRLALVDLDRAPPFEVTVFGVADLGDFELCPGVRDEARVPASAFDGRRSAEVSFRVCRVAGPAVRAATPTPLLTAEAPAPVGPTPPGTP